jgi:hypothetical protein
MKCFITETLFDMRNSHTLNKPSFSRQGVPSWLVAERGKTPLRFPFTLSNVPRMNLTVEQIAAEALALPSEARALLADRLVESLDPAEDGYVRQLWAEEARRRRDDVRSGRVQTIPGDQALASVRKAVGQ